ncbi:hypothetical protein O3P69_008481 [Scylla paramamosain]|uniref:Uncharacterized protein n=1 Tax=Scylla paramamosain TaxID=85552 RepID=A0AAW0SLA7_SCYPA
MEGVEEALAVAAVVVVVEVMALPLRHLPYSQHVTSQRRCSPHQPRTNPPEQPSLSRLPSLAVPEAWLGCGEAECKSRSAHPNTLAVKGVRELSEWRLLPSPVQTLHSRSRKLQGRNLQRGREISASREVEPGGGIRPSQSSEGGRGGRAGGGRIAFSIVIFVWLVGATSGGNWGLAATASAAPGIPGCRGRSMPSGAIQLSGVLATTVRHTLIPTLFLAARGSFTSRGTHQASADWLPPLDE